MLVVEWRLLLRHLLLSVVKKMKSASKVPTSPSGCARCSRTGVCEEVSCQNPNGSFGTCCKYTPGIVTCSANSCGTAMGPNSCIETGVWDSCDTPDDPPNMYNMRDPAFEACFWTVSQDLDPCTHKNPGDF